MKKLLIATAALVLSASAIAEWQAVEQTDDSITFKETELGSVMVMGKLAPTGTPMEEIAKGIASSKNCEAPAPATLAGAPGFHFACPGDVQAFVIDDGTDVLIVSGACNSKETCEAIDSLIQQISAE